MAGKRQYNVNDDFFSNWNMDMAYLLGFITADGYISRQDELVVSINYNDVELLQYMKRVMQIENPIRVYNDGNYKYCTLSIHSYKLCNDLYVLNVTNRKTYTIVAPPFIPEDMIKYYIRGLFDGDGSISVRRRKEQHQLSADVCITTASEQFVYQIHEILDRLKVNSRVNVYNDKREGRVTLYRLFIGGQAVINFGELIYDSNGFYLKRKYDKFNEYYTARYINCVKCNNKYFKIRYSSNVCDNCNDLLIKSSEAICSDTLNSNILNSV